MDKFPCSCDERGIFALRIQTPPSPCVVYCGVKLITVIKGFEERYHAGAYLATRSYAREGVHVWKPLGRERDRAQDYSTSGLSRWWSSLEYSWPSHACNRSLARISIASSGCSPRTF